MFGDHGVFRATSGPSRGHFEPQVLEHTRKRKERRARMKKSSLVVSDWTENLSSLGSSSSSDDDDEEEEILPTQTTTPSQTPEKTRKRLSVKTGDMSSPPLPEKEERATKIISVQFFSTDEEGEKERENVSTTTKEDEEEKCFETLVREEVERQRSKKEHLTVSFEEERGRRNCCYHVIPVTSRECLIECPLAYGNQAQADFEARLVERFSRRKNKMKVSEVDERENRYELKPLHPVSTKSRWRELLEPSVQVVGGGKRKEFYAEREERRKFVATPEKETTTTKKTAARRRIDDEYELPTKVDDFVWKDLPENIRNQYLIQVETQKNKKNKNKTEKEEEEAVLVVERRSAPNEYRPDTITTTPYQTATNVHNLNPSVVKEKITHALDMQSKERVDGRLNAILHVIRVIRNDLRRTRGREESRDFSDWIQHDLAKSFPGWRAKLSMAVNTNDLIPV
ncbi:unnamed protein product [Bathycoccus prasinos]|jgi:hypothetical protein